MVGELQILKFDKTVKGPRRNVFDCIITQPPGKEIKEGARNGIKGVMLTVMHEYV